jgi:coproporphyrinogen III oxidase-like Fe-S oxidoreductase
MAGRQGRRQLVTDPPGSRDQLGIYLHIPFCQAICGYCNFNRGLLDEPLRARYVNALERDIQRASTGQPADSLFFGGGTPSLLEPAEVERLIAACAGAFDLAADTEITLETNPETVTPDRLLAFRRAGVNRISFGVQSRSICRSPKAARWSSSWSTPRMCSPKTSALARSTSWASATKTSRARTKSSSTAR